MPSIDSLGLSALARKNDEDPWHIDAPTLNHLMPEYSPRMRPVSHTVRGGQPYNPSASGSVVMATSPLRKRRLR